MKSLADVVSGAGLAGYAEVALLLFFLVFLAIAWRVIARHDEALDRAARLPFDDGSDDAFTSADERSPTPRPEGNSHVQH